MSPTYKTKRLDGSGKTKQELAPIIEDLVDVGLSFFTEGHWSSRALDLTKARMNFDVMLRSLDHDVLIAYSPQGEPSGFLIMHYGSDWFDDWECFINLFYVMPKHRGTTVARQLLGKASEICDIRGVTYSYVTSTAGLGNDLKGKAFINLCKKYGFQEMGPTMMRKGKSHG